MRRSAFGIAMSAWLVLTTARAWAQAEPAQPVQPAPPGEPAQPPTPPPQGPPGQPPSQPPPPPGYQGYPGYPYPPPQPYYPQPYYQPPPRPLRTIRGYLGLSGVITAVAGQTGGVEQLSNGGGVAIWGGLRLTPIFALELDYTGSFHNPNTQCYQGTFYCFGSYLVLDMLSVDAKFHIPNSTNFDPFFQAGLLLSWIGREGFVADATGGGFDAGGGFDLWLSPWWTFGIRVLYRGVKMGDFGTLTGSSTFLSVVTGDINIAVHF